MNKHQLTIDKLIEQRDKVQERIDKETKGLKSIKDFIKELEVIHGAYVEAIDILHKDASQ